MKKICPLIKSECLEHGCEFYTHLIGQNPQTGEQKDDFGCAIKFLPILLVENAGQIRQVAASSDKVASEVRKHHATFVSVLNQDSQTRLLDADPQMKLESK